MAQEYKKWHVGIIGAGASGLVNLKTLMEKGFTGECWEMQTGLGGVYLSTYQQAQLTTSNLSVTFSDYSHGDESIPRMYMANEYRDYLKGYSDHYGLTPFLHFQKKVQKVEKSAEGEKYNLIVECLQSGETTTYTYDKIIVCTGANTTASIPCWPGQENFKGQIVHSSVYDSPEDFRGKRVCLIGVGESGSDIAGLVSKVASASVMVKRGKHGHIVNRYQIPPLPVLKGSAVDQRPWPSDLDTNRSHYCIPRWAGPTIGTARARGQGMRGDATGDAVMSKTSRMNGSQNTHGFAIFGTKNDSFVKAIVYNGLELKPSLDRIDGQDLHFEDGSVFENCDAIILNTGYRMSFPFLEEICPDFCACPDVRSLWKHSFHADLGTDVMFSGFARPAFGALPPCSEMQARYISMLLTGERVLPPKDVQLKLTELEAEQEMWQYDGAAKRVKGLVDFLLYMDGMAEVIGCYLNFWRMLHLLVTNPRVWHAVNFSPIGGVQYRLYGPDAKNQYAKQALSASLCSRFPDRYVLMAWSWFFWIFGKMGVYFCTRSGSGLEYRKAAVFADAKKRYGWTPLSGIEA
ncbi:hypothetical protein CYMTET_12618 [Cymbomonas tetramitiformis]|uniref:Flavin-containing monooxygenase n=1 Tax=Cymbomonas tetramitiformis TaxID=36881 RepID=A0AAE0GJR5_9CHLO|nr:hypothetical protein CYMTET_12618 [Cymbomonas tetramitiformis]